MPPKHWMKACARAVSMLEAPLRDGEVNTRFGRTAPLFACSEHELVPNLMTVAKGGLSSGYVPVRALFLSDQVYDTIADDTGTSGGGGIPTPPIR